MKDQCIHPTSQKSYILSAIGGKDNSPEGLQVCDHVSAKGLLEQDRDLVNTQQGVFTHTWVLEFASKADRDYYIADDPAHKAFGSSLTGIVQKVMVMDFAPGVF